MRRRALVLIVALAVAGCGGDDDGGALSEADTDKLAAALDTITAECIEGIREQTGEGDGAEAGPLAEAVDTTVDLYEDHGGDAEFQLTPAAPTFTLRQFLRDRQTTLADCAPDQAAKIDEALE